MKKVFYPKIEGATPIYGWVNREGISYSISPGEDIVVDEESAMVLTKTFKFLIATDESVRSVNIEDYVGGKKPTKEDLSLLTKAEEKGKIIEGKSKKNVKKIAKEVEVIEKDEIAGSKANEDEITFECSDCGFTSKSLAGLASHKRSHEKKN